MTRQIKKIITIMLVFAMVVALAPSQTSQAAKKPKFNKTKLQLKEGKTYVLSIKNGAKKAKVSWKTSNKKVAAVTKKVAKGKNYKATIVGKKKGSATITATYKKAGKKKVTLKCKVTVKKETVVDEPIIIPEETATVAPTAVPTPDPTETPDPAQVAHDADVAALKAIITAQRANGASLSVKTDNNCYTWNESGRLTVFQPEKSSVNGFL